MNRTPVLLLLLLLWLPLQAQRYSRVIDKTVAVVGGEMISLSDLEEGVRYQRGQRFTANDRQLRCEMLERMMTQKLFLMQARVDSLSVNMDNVENQLRYQEAEERSRFGGDEAMEAYYGKPLYKLRQEWRQALQDANLAEQMQSQVVQSAPEVSPNEVKAYVDSLPKEDLPMVSEKYKMSQICLYPDREAAKLAVKEKLLELRSRIIAGEKFSTLARIYSEDIGSARRGGELGMISKSMLWPAFSDAAMALKPGVISQIVETPDGFHIIEVLEKKGDMFNARHILLRPSYTTVDRDKAFHKLDSLRTEILSGAVTFEFAARFYSEDPSSRTNGGQMADPMTGSAYFMKDQIKTQDFAAIRDLKEGEISAPVESLDNEGRSGHTVYKIIRLDKILPAHPATLQNDYDVLVQEVQTLGRRKAIEAFIDEKIKTTYIVIDPMFAGCPFEHAGWSAKIRKD